MPSTATRSPAFAGALRSALNVVSPAHSSGPLVGRVRFAASRFCRYIRTASCVSRRLAVYRDGLSGQHWRVRASYSSSPARFGRSPASGLSYGATGGFGRKAQSPHSRSLGCGLRPTGKTATKGSSAERADSTLSHQIHSSPRRRVPRSGRSVLPNKVRRKIARDPPPIVARAIPATRGLGGVGPRQPSIVQLC